MRPHHSCRGGGGGVGWGEAGGMACTSCCSLAMQGGGRERLSGGWSGVVDAISDFPCPLLGVSHTPFPQRLTLQAE